MRPHCVGRLYAEWRLDYITTICSHCDNFSFSKKFFRGPGSDFSKKPPGRRRHKNESSDTYTVRLQVV